MKKLILALSLTVLMTAFGCKKDEIVPPNPPPPIPAQQVTYRVTASEDSMRIGIGFIDLDYDSVAQWYMIDNPFYHAWEYTFYFYGDTTQLNPDVAFQASQVVYFSTPDCPEPPPNVYGSIHMELWVGGVLKKDTIFTTTESNENRSGTLGYNF